MQNLASLQPGTPDNREEGRWREISISLKTLMGDDSVRALLPSYSLISGSLQAKRPASTIIRR